MIQYLVYVDDYGDIRMIKPAKGDNNPAEGIGADGLNCRHLLEPLANAGLFMETNFWSTSASAWLTRIARPNRHATWEGRWVWDSELLIEDIRKERNKKLFQCDWAVVVDSPLSPEQREEAIAYRTLLRDLPLSLDMPTVSSVEEVVWPTAPTFL